MQCHKNLEHAFPITQAMQQHGQEAKEKAEADLKLAEMNARATEAEQKAAAAQLALEKFKAYQCLGRVFSDLK